MIILLVLVYLFFFIIDQDSRSIIDENKPEIPPAIPRHTINIFNTVFHLS